MAALATKNSLFFRSLSFLHVTNSVLVHLTRQTYIKSSLLSEGAERNGKSSGSFDLEWE